MIMGMKPGAENHSRKVPTEAIHAQPGRAL